MAPMKTKLFFLLIPLMLGCVALSPKVQAKGGPPINCNTSEGYQALLNITTDVNRTAFGCEALFADTTGSAQRADGALDDLGRSAHCAAQRSLPSLIFN